MNLNIKFLINGRAAGGCVMLLALLSVAVAQPVPPAVTTPPPVPLSIFIQPSSPKEGRDPFFPLSTRPYTSAVVATNTKDLSSLVMVGMSGTPEHPLVIINNITFAVGDEREVVTPQGRIRIRCIQIIGDMAVIEANGQRHQLRYGLKP